MIIQIPNLVTTYIDLKSIVSVDLLCKIIHLSNGEKYVLDLRDVTNIFHLWVKEHGPLVDVEFELRRDKKRMLVEEYD